MNSIDRRDYIENILKKNNEPIKGIELSQLLSVSRQVIVQDIAILRAKGMNIMATPQGYIMPVFENKSLLKVITSNHHSTIKEIKEELCIIVDMGGKVLDVIIEHPLYGEIRGVINISSRKEIEDFVEKLKTTNTNGICSLTNGYHFHTIEIKDEDTYKGIVSKLKEKKYIQI